MASGKYHQNQNGGESVADKLGLGPEVREIKLGASFTNKGAAFHTIRYDFKPASVDTSKVATVDLGQNNQVTVTVPHLDSASTTQTVFKGSRKPHPKECVLIIDPATGEITLEKLSNNIQVKKMRMEGSNSKAPSHPVVSSVPMVESSKPKHSKQQHRPVQQQQRQQNKSPNTFGQRVSPPSYQETLHLPTHKMVSPIGHTNSPKNQQVSPSMPIIGMDASPPHHPSQDVSKSTAPPDIGILTDSSSNDSSSSSGSDSDSDSDGGVKTFIPSNGRSNPPVSGSHLKNGNVPDLLSSSLVDDLQLSESGSDSD